MDYLNAIGVEISLVAGALLALCAIAFRMSRALERIANALESQRESSGDGL